MVLFCPGLDIQLSLTSHLGRITMKNKKYLAILKTLFDPLSKEWEETSFEEKRKEIQKKFQKEKFQNMALDHYISGFSIVT